MSTDTVDDLRDAWLATISAADRAGAHLHGAGPLGRRLPWQDAVTECWRALSLVYAGLAASTQPPGTSARRSQAGSDTRSSGSSVGGLLAGLSAARVDADRAVALAARVRWRLGAAEDQLRRTRIVADAVAARQFAAAITRLDLVGARLAVGGRRIDRSAAALIGVLAAPPVRSGGTSTNGDAHRTDSTTSDNRNARSNAAGATHHASNSASDAGGDTRDADSDRVRAEQIACGCHAASALVAGRRPRSIRRRRW
ncbi:hypothetical protein [Micromonospora chokoriensis]|uniref:Uncharacterized protein n=1 Tax=Micromonospora chokoriensis TaxID=356851 RepID=A0A1C4WZC6_9ACTN|nr:hypothetical protein [Micromonospora chokoriensis]SCF01504.1 hypothetical protein GA0070612_3036 [Micromonospora chokoriensis]